MRALPMFFLLLAACDRGPEIPTAAENRDLDEAANMLDGADNTLAEPNETALPPADPASETALAPAAATNAVTP